MIAPPLRFPITVVPAAEAATARSAQRLLLVTLFAAPLLFGAVQPWVWGAMAALVAVAFSLWAAGCWRESALRIVWSPLYVPALLFLVLMAAQRLLGRTADPIAAREALLKAATYVLILFLAINLFADAPQRRWRMLGWAITAYTYGVAVFAIVQYFSGTDRLYWMVKPRWGGYIFGPYVSHNHYAGLMEMLIPAVVTFLLGTRSLAQRALIGFGLLIALLSMVLAGSRGGATAMLVEAAVLAAVLLPMRPSRAMLVAAGGFVALTLIAALWLIPANVSERYSSAIHAPELSYGIRRNMTRDALAMGRSHPVLGVGLGSFEAAYPKYQSFASDLLIDYAHNDYAQFLAETGLLGASIAAIALVMLGAGFVRQARRGLRSEASFLKLGAFLGCIGLLAHSWVDFNFHIPANAAWFAFLLGITQIPDGMEFEPARALNTTRALARMRTHIN